MDKKVKKVSKKKILFVELDEEITSIFEKVEKLNYKEVYLVVPKRAILLQSIVNLRILNQKIEEIDKKMAIITADTNGMKLAQQAEIKVFDHWDMDDGVKKGKKKKDKDSALLTPISASSNAAGDDAPSRLPQKKSSIFEVVRTLRGKDQGFSLKSYLKDRKKNRLQKEPFHLYLPGGNKKFITGLVVTSVLVFGLIAYVALPGATVSIEPASSVLTKAVNITLENNPSEVHSLKAYPVEADADLTISHSASGILSEGANASGYLTIINTTENEWPLIASTRFQTEDGVVFRIQDSVTVPAAATGVPGEADAFVLADSLDANGTPTGERGNIGPSSFILPGLKESSQAELYGESYDFMTGGESVVSAIVTEEDLIAAEEKLETQLKEKVLSALRKEVLSESNSENVTLNLLEDSDVLIYGAADIDLPYELIGQEMETFEVSGDIEISGVAYDEDEILLILKSEIMTSTTPGKQLVRIDDDSVSTSVLESNPDYNYYKFTAQIQGIEEYEIDPELEGGSKLTKKIKEHIAGKSVEEAESYVQNLPEVNSVDISIWPGWSPTIPTLPENIKIKSVSEGESL
jgi:hypothetical protein